MKRLWNVVVVPVVVWVPYIIVAIVLGHCHGS